MLFLTLRNRKRRNEVVFLYPSQEVSYDWIGGLCSCPGSLISELTQQDDRKKRAAKRLCERNVTGITCQFCRDLHLTLLCSAFLQKDLSEAR